MATHAPVLELETPEVPAVPRRTERRRSGLAGTAALAAGGSAMLALASDLPASPFGPHAGGVWPFAASGAARTWEGPALPGWAQPANAGPGVPSGHLLVLALVVLGVVLLGVAWLRLWRSVRSDRGLGFQNVWWVVAAWTAPLLFAAPFASQDAWAYAAQGKAVASGLNPASPLHLLGHSVWLSGVDPRYLSIPSVYGPGANDLSALFASASGGHPWVAVEGWRLAVIASLVLCAWGVARVAAVRGANPVEAVIAGVANPAVLVVLVAGVHNDAIMIGLVVAGVGLAVTKRPWWAFGVAALAVTIKAPAALGILAIAWWCWEGWRRRALAIGAGIGASVVALALTGLPSGGGFSWLSPTLMGNVASSFSILRLTGITASGPVNLVQLLGILAATVLALAVARGRSWVGALAIGFAVMALTAAHPQPWYLLWAVPIVACTFVDGGVQRSALVVMCVMVAWSVLPFGPTVWVIGAIALAVIGVRWRRSWQVVDVLPRAQPAPACDGL